ncbi:metal ABC transporter permease [Salibacterium salarium]|uniref:Metal ABC transporter permease n=1 Tax=Salibacterium salarium TaxID=284579 RepID=A0A428MXQ3_9BACI|nr:metal ABC transporter permease [Salibacterium salarium]RSL30917.1 metal ABC transporter permease [Salibacterium salarium]
MMDDFLTYDFLQNAFLTGIMIGFLAPVLGVFIVVRRLALITDALSHVTLTGIAFHLLLAQSYTSLQAVNPLYMGMVFSTGASLLMEKLRHVYTAYRELAIPIILSTGIGLGVVFISLADGFNNDLFNYLFGSIIAVTREDLWAVTIITIIVSGLLLLFYKELLFLSFDEEQALVSGIPGKLINLLFVVMTAIVIASSMRIVGILLVSSLMTLPVASAIQLSKSFKQMFVYSVIIGEVSVITGLFSAFYLDVSPGGTIVMIALSILLVVLACKKMKRTPVKAVHRKMPHTDQG